MRFCVLGPLEAYADGRNVAVGGGRQRALLALLLIHAGEVVSRDRLLEELWAGEPPPSGPQSLDAYLSRLRKAFREAGAGEILVTRTPGYVLHAEDIDTRRFEALTAEGRKALVVGEDIDWLARAKDAGVRSERLDRVFLRYRIHSNNISRHTARNREVMFQILRRSVHRQNEVERG